MIWKYQLMGFYLLELFHDRLLENRILHPLEDEYDRGNRRHDLKKLYENFHYHLV